LQQVLEQCLAAKPRPPPSPPLPPEPADKVFAAAVTKYEKAFKAEKNPKKKVDDATSKLQKPQNQVEEATLTLATLKEEQKQMSTA